MAISKELQLGKAGEHLVVADLILKGYSAFLSDQGLNYDVVADVGSRLVRVQVKTTLGPKYYMHRSISNIKKGKKQYEGQRCVYRFGMRRGMHTSKRTVAFEQVDVLAFVALDTRRIAYINASELVSKNGTDLIIAVEFTVNDKSLNRGVKTWGRRMETYEQFPVQV